jgi:hypothetical protein
MGTNTPKSNRPDETAADQKLVDGLTKHASTITSMVIGGVSMTSAAIIAELEARIAASLNTQTAKAAWQAAIVVEKAQRAKTKTFASGLRQAILVAFAGQVDALADFGLTPRKVAIITPAEKTARAAKAKATRAARHTMGKVQKAQITGTNPNGTPEPAPIAPAPAVPPATPTALAPAPAPAPVMVFTIPVPAAAPAPAPSPVTAPAVPVAPAPAVASPALVTPAAVTPTPVAEPAVVPTPAKP